MKKDLILTCDAGTTGCKCTVFDEHCEAVYAVKRSYPTFYPRPTEAEQDPADVAGAVLSAIRELTERVGADRICAIGLSGTMNGCIPVDESGNVLHRNIIHSDTRTEEQLGRIRSVIGEDPFYRITGNRIDTHYTLPKILWMRENEHGIWEKTRWWLNTKDHLYGVLTGRWGYTDPSDASLAAAMDLKKRTWATELLRDLHVDPETMPRLIPGHNTDGKLCRAAAERTGLPEGLPVAIGGGDGACTARGAGVCTPGSGYTYIGSSAWVSQIRPEAVIDPQKRIFNYLDMDGESCHVCGTAQCGASAFDWARSNLMPGIPSPEEAEELAKTAVPGAEGVLFLPTLMGWRTPYWDANTRGVLLGFTLYHGRKHIARAVYEGIAYALTDCVRIMTDCGAGMDRMILTGGGALSTLWPDMLASMYGMKVSVHAAPGETTSLGAAVAAGVGVGMFPDYRAAADRIRTRAESVPDPETEAIYRKGLELYRRIYPGVKPIQDLLASEVSDGAQ